MSSTPSVSLLTRATPSLARERSATLPWAMSAIAILGIALCRVEVLTTEWGFDAGAWLYISQLMGEGYKPYVDVWDNKLPPVLWIGRLVLASGSPHLVMFVVDVLFTFAGVIGIALFLESLGARRRTALFFGGLHVLATLPAWEGPHRLEVYSVGCMSVGLALIVRAGRVAGPLRLACVACAGSALAASASFRPQEALSAVVLAPLALSLGPTRFGPFAAYLVGAATFVAVLVLAAAAGGYLDAMIQVGVLGSLSYAAGGETPGLLHLGKTINSLRRNVERMPVAWLVASAGCILGAGVFRGLDVRQRLYALSALALFAMHVAVTFLSGHQWTHYHYPIGWSACLLLGTGWVLWRKGQAPFRNLLGASPELLLVAALLVTVPFTQRVYAGLHRLVAGERESRVDQVEQLIRQHVPADEGPMLVDAYDVIGVFLRLPHPLGSYWSAWAPQCVYEDPARAEEEPDPFFLTSARWGARLIERFDQDGAPWVVRQRGRRDRLSAVLERDYIQVAESPEFELWRRIPRIPPEPQGGATVRQ